MNVFLEEISYLKRLFRMNLITTTILVASVIFLIIHAVIAGLAKWEILLFSGAPFIYGIIIGFSLVLAFVYILFRKKRFIDVLIDMDGRLKLKDRICTAYEYWLTAKKTPFADLLITDAGDRLRSIDKKELFPFKFSPIHLLIALLVLVNVFILFAGHLAALPSRDRMGPATLEEVRRLLKDYTPDRSAVKERKEQIGSHKLRDQMEDISKRLEDRDVSREKISSSVSSALKEIQSEKTALSRGLASTIETENIEEVPIPKMQEIKKLALYNSKKLEEVLGRMFDDKIPGTVRDSLVILKEYENLEDLLKQVLNHIDMDISSENRLNTPPQGRDEGLSGEMDGQGGERKSPGEDKGKEGDRISQREGSRQTESTGTAQGEKERGREPEKERGDASEQGSSSTAGRGKSDEKGKSPHDIEKASGQTLQDKMTPSSVEDHALRIRSLTTLGKARMKKEDVIRSYRKEIESVLTKEDIPLNYREYIKNYFLSINLRKDAENQ